MRGSLVLILFSSLDFQALSARTQKRARSCFAPDDAKRQDSSRVLTLDRIITIFCANNVS